MLHSDTFVTMQPLTQLGNALLRTLRDHLRPLIAYHLLFTLLASALLVPAVAWVSQRFLAQLNRTVVTTDALLALLFSPLGLLVMLVGLGFTFLLIYWQQAGMSQVAVRPKDNHYRLAFEALWLSTRRLPALAVLVTLQVSVVFAMAKASIPSRLLDVSLGSLISGRRNPQALVKPSLKDSLPNWNPILGKSEKTEICV